MFYTWPLRKNVNRIPRLRSITLRHKPLQRPNGDRRVKLSAAASWLARMTAYAATNRRKRIGDPGVTVGFFVSSLRDQRHVPSGLCMDRACLHAREVRLQPL